MNQQDDFRRSVQRDTEREQNGERERAGLVGLFMYGGVVGLLLAIPMVAGAYLGRWLDSLSPEFGTRWTVSLIILGVVAGIFNVVWYIRERL
ncbi:MAG: AtpZ/AtpI family protein [Pseudomonadota bacterium]|nr:ATP synthase subunit [Pseudomonadales bacterium]MDY6921004.1 AtpZ/AtpI family protein [Pseudomonadota bacterium]